MKAAIIPPIPELGAWGQGKFHLVLSHLLKDQTYKRHYMVQRAANSYLVLDNSAHEHKAGEQAELLLRQARAIRAQEIVVPDVLFDYDATVTRAIQTLELWVEGEQRSAFHEVSPVLMYVPQGRDERSWAYCLRDLVNIHYMAFKHGNYEKVQFVIGLSKDYETFSGGLMHLIDTYLVPVRNQCQRLGMRMHVHMLGWGRDLWAMREIAEKHKWIRSTDSAKPFVYALNNILLDPLHEPPAYPGRGRTYFDSKLRAWQRNYAEVNVQMFRRMAEGR